MKRIINTDKAPAPIGPYNQATEHQGTLYISGQIAIVPSTSELLEGSIEEETHQVLKNLGAILENAGYTFENVLKCSVFVKDMNLFGRINKVYGEYFGEANAPARDWLKSSTCPNL